jgi:hypothetical protein
MKLFTLVLVCSLVCVACSRPLRTLSDGQPGYFLTCDTLRERCLKESALICRGKGYYIVSERAQETRQDIDWTDTGAVNSKFNSRYWMEIRCEGVDVKPD